MRLEWEQEVALPPEQGYGSLLALAADCAQAAERVPLVCGVHVLLTDDARIRQVNREQRGVDRATDVLSFPTVRYPAGKTARDSLAALRREYDPDADACVLGDILISWEHALKQAAEYGHSARRELCYLLTHGIFHLFGYDHIDPDDQKEMRRMEEQALELAGVTRDDAPGAAPGDEQLLSLARQAMQRAYAPYSRYRVGACLLSADGRLFTGCNIENASFGLPNCAERTALIKAVSEGAREFAAIVIASDGSAPWPCGACRQALNEFAPDLRVLVTWGAGKTAESTLPALLPRSFGPKSLEEKE